MRMNSKMAAFLEEIKTNKTKRPEVLNHDLRKLLENSFVEEEGCIFLRNLYNDSVAGQLSYYDDRTGYECFVNHVHIDSYVDVDEKDMLGLLDQAILYSSELKDKLKKSFRHDSFRIIISFEHADCTVRFHKIRPNETWLSENLEGYSEAIMVMDTGLFNGQNH